MRRGYDRVEGSIGRSYDEITGVTMSVSRDSHMLGKITTGNYITLYRDPNRNINQISNH